MSLGIKGILEREIDAVSRFLLLLENEQIALKSAQPESLPSISQQKSELIIELNALETERCQQIGLVGAAEDARTAMQRWLDQPGTPVDLGSTWARLLELARQAKAMSELNGKLVILHLEQTNQALAALSRRQPSGLYSSDGQTSGYSGSRIVDSA